jgi:hypothetical protein
VETPAPRAPLCFVLMTFGRKTDAAGRVTNFDSVYEKLIAPRRTRSVVRPPATLRPGAHQNLAELGVLEPARAAAAAGTT